jgi:flagellar biosynthesis/type III secretory pathway M-ring protein FliF/YscJ
MRAVTVLAMPKSRRATPPRSTQIDNAPWERFGDAAKAVGMSRAGLMKTLVLWFIQWPGVKLPDRPTRAKLDAMAAEREAAEQVDERPAS